MANELKVLQNKQVTETIGTCERENECGLVLPASLSIRNYAGIQCWPDDRTTIAVPNPCHVEVGFRPDTMDGFIRIEGTTQFNGTLDVSFDDICLYIPTNGSVVIEVAE